MTLADPFRLEIKPELSDHDRKQLFGWAPDIFGVAKLPFEWRLKDLHFIAYDGALAVSHVGTVSHTVEVNGQPVIVCGVGGVTTRPEYQGRGLAGGLLEEALSYGRQTDGAAFGFLHCFPRLVPYYERHGWHALESPVLVKQPQGETLLPVRTMVHPLTTGEWPAGTVRVLSLPW
jgi:predicted N-acetyltransferase YhbS